MIVAIIERYTTKLSLVFIEVALEGLDIVDAELLGGAALFIMALISAEMASQPMH